MKSLYDQIHDMADSMQEAVAMLRDMADGNADQARALKSRCRSVPYSGDVLCFEVDKFIAEVLSDEDAVVAE